MQDLGSNHIDLEQYIGMLAPLNEMTYHLQIEALKFSRKNCRAIINIQESLQVLHHCRFLVESGSDSFSHVHLATVVASV